MKGHGMIQQTHQLSPSTVDSVIAHIESQLGDRFSLDVSNYAPGRKRLWLEHEGPLGNQKFKPATHDPKLWHWIVEVASKSGMQAKPELALIVSGDVGIKLHRDATYAAPHALSINLGPTTFLYNPCLLYTSPSPRDS